MALVVGAMLAIVYNTTSAHSDGSVAAGNQNCSDLIPGALELRINQPADGTFPPSPTDGFSVTIDVRTLTSDDPNHPGNQTGSQVFDFTATGGSVIGVAVKGGPDANFYDYRPDGVTSGTGLHAPLNTGNNKFYGLSHISFCYVLKASPTISTNVSDDVITIGESFYDTATLAGGNNPTGTINFKLYGPDDATCAGTPVVDENVTVNGNGDYDSPTFTPTAVGVYRWVASYSGDAANNPVSGACNDANENVTVNKSEPTLATVPKLLPNDRATIAGLVNPSGGTLTFSLFRNADCSGTAAYTEQFTVNANGSFDTTNSSVFVTQDETINWVVVYSGDASNEDATSPCGNEQIVMDFTVIP